MTRLPLRRACRTRRTSNCLPSSRTGGLHEATIAPGISSARTIRRTFSKPSLLRDVSSTANTEARCSSFRSPMRMPFRSKPVMLAGRFDQFRRFSSSGSYFTCSRRSSSSVPYSDSTAATTSAVLSEFETAPGGCAASLFGAGWFPEFPAISLYAATETASTRNARMRRCTGLRSMREGGLFMRCQPVIRRQGAFHSISVVTLCPDARTRCLYGRALGRSTRPRQSHMPRPRLNRLRRHR